MTFTLNNEMRNEIKEGINSAQKSIDFETSMDDLCDTLRVEKLKDYILDMKKALASGKL